MRGVSLIGGIVRPLGYPDAATVHGMQSADADELVRLKAFLKELYLVEQWLNMIPDDFRERPADAMLFSALADAALLAFCRCFDAKRPLKVTSLGVV